MNEKDIIEYFKELCDEHNVPHPKDLKINRRLSSTLGRVQYRRVFTALTPVSVHFNKELLGEGVDFARDIIKHEFAHYYLLCQNIDDGHGPIFKAFCKKLNCVNSGTKAKNDLDRNGAVDREGMPKMVASKYTVICSSCNKSVGTYSRWCKTLDRVSNDHAVSGCCKAPCSIVQNW